MRIPSLFASLALAWGVLAPLTAQASLRDASLGVQGDSALALVRFDAQPQTVQVRADPADPARIEVLVTGVSASAGRIVPPDNHLVRAIDMAQGEAGLRLVYHFNQAPLQSAATIYDHAVLLRSRFAAPPKPQHAALHFEQAAPSRQVASRTPPKASHKAHKPAAKGHSGAAVVRDSDALAQAAHDGGTSYQPMHDGDIQPPHQHQPPKSGIGPVREAAYKRHARSLDASSCAAAKKAIEDDPWALDKLSLYGSCLAKEGKTREAKEVFERLLTFDPDMVSAYVGLGAIAQHNGDIKAARDYYQKAEALGGTDAEATQVRALLGSLPGG